MPFIPETFATTYSGRLYAKRSIIEDDADIGRIEWLLRRATVLYEVHSTHGLIFPLFISCDHSFDSLCVIHFSISASLHLLHFGHDLRAAGTSSNPEASS